VMSDVDPLIREGLAAQDPLPPGAEGDWHDVLGRVERPRQHRRWALAAGGVTAVAVVAIAVLVILPSGGGGPTPAAAALNRLARLVATQSLTPQPGQYLYIDSTSEYGAFSGSCETRAVEHRQLWIGADGSGLDRGSDAPGHFTSAADRAACLQQARQDGTQHQLQQQLAAKTNSDWNAPNCFELNPLPNGQDWSDLSSDPHVLLQQITPSDDASRRPYDEFDAIANLLRFTDAPPAVRATLYQAAALIPGVQYLGAVRDHDGRPGLGVEWKGDIDGPGTYELIFDPQTGLMIGEQETGTLAGWAVYPRQEVVDRLPSKPPGPLGPPCHPATGGVVHPVPGEPNTTISNGAPLTSP
jgi:hypothetical protein